MYNVHTGISSRKADVLVIGGGLAGCATAYYLAREGAGVTLVERSDLNMQASGANAGGFHAQIPHLTFMEEGEAWARHFAPVVEMLLAGIRLWGTLEEELDCDLEYHIGGGILIADKQAQMRDIERRMAIERSVGLEIHALTRDELQSIAPYASRDMVGGCYCPAEGKANPLKATRAFARRAVEKGAVILRNTEVTGLEANGHGFLVRTGRGSIQAARVINCAGADAGRIAAMLNMNVAIQGFPIQVSVTAAAEQFIKHLVYAAGLRLTLKQAANGTLLIGGGWPARINGQSGQAVVDLDSLLGNLRVAKQVVPAIGEAQLVRSWAAIVNGTADWKPIIGEAPKHKGFYFNLFPWTGFTAGPISALVTSELVRGCQPSIDIGRYSALSEIT